MTVPGEVFSQYNITKTFHIPYKHSLEINEGPVRRALLEAQCDHMLEVVLLYVDDVAAFHEHGYFVRVNECELLRVGTPVSLGVIGHLNDVSLVHLTKDGVRR